MAPLRKSKKRKRVAMNPVNPPKISPLSSQPENLSDPRPGDVDWWSSFSLKNSGPQVPQDEEEAFKHFFHLSKNTFNYVCSLVQEDLVSRPPSGLINIEGRLLSVDKQVAIALRRLASGDSQVSVGDAFGIGQSTVSQVTWRFVESMEERARHHLHWPSPAELAEIKSSIEADFGLPNCCGAVGSAKVVMTLPAVESSDDWRDKDNNYSMSLQGVVDHELRFVDVATGWPGSVNPGQLLRWSGLFKLCEAGRRLASSREINAAGFELREYIVGGQEYPLLPWLMVPYGGAAGLPLPAAVFDARQKAVAGLAASAFGYLKGTWRILHKEFVPFDAGGDELGEPERHRDAPGWGAREALARYSSS
ncbi:nuclease isoform X2 [Wolffia australiana]